MLLSSVLTVNASGADRKKQAPTLTCTTDIQSATQSATNSGGLVRRRREPW
jgi:hypothetical protein